MDKLAEAQLVLATLRDMVLGEDALVRAVGILVKNWKKTNRVPLPWPWPPIGCQHEDLYIVGG